MRSQATSPADVASTAEAVYGELISDTYIRLNSRHGRATWLAGTGT